MNKVLNYLLVGLVIISCQKEEPTPITASQEVVYYSSKETRTDAWQIFRKDLESRETISITDDPQHNYWWVKASKDNTQLLLLRSPISSPEDQFDYANCEMIKCDANGSNKEVIIADNQYDWFAFGNPHWHPNGDRILMIAQTANSNAPYYSYTVDVNGNNPKQITNQYSIDAHWNKEGDKITFIGIDGAGFVDASSLEVYVADYNYSANEVSAVTQLTSDDTRNHDPCFSPDGTRIAFSASNDNLTDADLVAIDVSGNNRTELINDNGIHGGPLNWGEDGKIYHHSIYIGTSNFTANAFNTITDQNEVLLESNSAAFISPHYLKL